MAAVAELPDPICADCIAFSAERLDEDGQPRGNCRFRPELGLIPETLPCCGSFQVRQSRSDKVRVPRPARPARSRASAGPRGHAAEEPRRRTLKDLSKGETSGEITMDRDGLRQVLRELLEEETLFGYPELGRRWEGGTLVLRPGDQSTQPREVPLETFFHKIVMLRDRLRVLEAKLNSHERLSGTDKMELQGYISKCYGTLTTFNILFNDKEDHFSSR